MKKITLFIIAATLLYSCNTAQENGFKISGKITNASGKELILSKLTTKEVLNIDTVKLDETGAFTFTGIANNPDFYMLSISKNDFLNLIVDSVDNITVNADAATFAEEYTVEGSKDSKLLKNLYVQLTKTLHSIDSLKIVFNNEKTDLNQDSLKVALNPQIIKFINGQKEYTKKFIDENINSMACLIALSQAIAPREPVLSFKDDMEYFEKVDKALMKKYPEADAVVSLHAYLEKVKNSGPANTVGLGQTAPEIDLPSPDGKQIKLSSLRGNYVLLDFWAGWCRPCRVENPNVVKNYYKYKSKGFTIFQVSLDKTKESWVNAIKTDKLGAWIHVSDLQYWNSAASKRYGVTGIPANFLIDPQGKIIATNLRGPVLGQKLSEIYGY